MPAPFMARLLSQLFSLKVQIGEKSDHCSVDEVTSGIMGRIISTMMSFSINVITIHRRELIIANIACARDSSSSDNCRVLEELCMLRRKNLGCRDFTTEY
jgi:hypothetical protein